MRKRSKKIAALGITVAMVAMNLAACGGDSSNNGSTASSSTQASSTEQSSQPATESSSGAEVTPTTITYPLQTSEKLTFGMVLATEWSDRFNSWTDLPIGKAIQKETGVELEMVQVENNTAMNLLFASGELPDIVLFNFQGNYSGGEIKAIEDGIIYPMDAEFLQENAPDYWAVLNSNEDIMKGSTNQQNQVFGFTFIMGDPRCKTGYGLTVRDDWCEKLGLDVTQIDTAEEFHDMLSRFKNELNVEIPMTITSANLTELLDYGVITSPFDLVTRDAYQIDGTVHIGYAEKEYKDVLAYLNQLYSEGLLDPNFSTTDKATVTANMLSGTSGVSSGALGGGIGTRGPGEKKLETDRRLIRTRISALKAELAQVEKHRELIRGKRSRGNLKTAAIVGYTNAGKSTLLNTLTGAGILAEDKLFATLDPTTRVLELKDGQQILLTDTVGFIRKLPHHLVEAFKSTLEEAKYADYIIHVVDASNPQRDKQMYIVYETLDHLGVKNKKILTLFNKIDIRTDDDPLQDFRADHVLQISAAENAGLDAVKDVLQEMLREDKIYIERVIPYAQAGVLQLVRNKGELVSEEYVPEGISIRAYVPMEVYGKL